MQRTISAILLFVVFISLQFGKVATYLYCKFDAEIIQNKTDCACDDHLVTMFEHHDDDSSKNDLSKNTVNEKLNEFAPRAFIAPPQVFISSYKCFTAYNSSLPESFLDSPLRPPIA
jgi:hypothetical protein